MNEKNIRLNLNIIYNYSLFHQFVVDFLFDLVGLLFPIIYVSFISSS